MRTVVRRSARDSDIVSNPKSIPMKFLIVIPRLLLLLIQLFLAVLVARGALFGIKLNFASTSTGVVVVVLSVVLDLLLRRRPLVLPLTTNPDQSLQATLKLWFSFVGTTLAYICLVRLLLFCCYVGGDVVVYCCVLAFVGGSRAVVIRWVETSSYRGVG
uniref:(northern house mosquito) hypothetical protein n=1 Tax=Culex pipiens TaxID=7175 RepID=A0A8D8A9M6_CULPI